MLDIYYDGTLSGAHAYGKARDLRTATVEDAAGATLDTKYYRYWTSDSSTGYTGGLKYVVHADSHARLAAAAAGAT